MVSNSGTDASMKGDDRGRCVPTFCTIHLYNARLTRLDWTKKKQSVAKYVLYVMHCSGSSVGFDLVQVAALGITLHGSYDKLNNSLALFVQFFVDSGLTLVTDLVFLAPVRY